MRWPVALACVALGACNLLFRAEPDPTPTQDAPADDAPAPDQLGVRLVITKPVYTQQGRIDVDVRTTGDKEVFFRVTAAGGGTFLAGVSPNVHEGSADPGAVETKVAWQPPPSFGRVTFTALAGYDRELSAPAMDMSFLDVQQYLGHYTVPSAVTPMIPANRLLAAPIQLAQEGRLVGLGAQLVIEAGVHVKLALYSTDGNIPPRPFELKAVTPSLDIGTFPGRVEVDLPSQILPPGQYWVALISDKQFSIIGLNAADTPQVVSTPADFMSALPSPFGGASPEVVTLSAYAMFGPVP